MIPIVNVGNIADLGEKQGKRICSCRKMCKHFLTITTYKDGLMLCEDDARKFAFEILKNARSVRVEGDLISVRREWTVQEEQYLLDKVENGVKRGMIQETANALGMTRQQVKNKIQYLRDIGKIKRKGEK